MWCFAPKNLQLQGMKRGQLFCQGAVIGFGSTSAVAPKIAVTCCHLSFHQATIWKLPPPSSTSTWQKDAGLETLRMYQSTLLLFCSDRCSQARIAGENGLSCNGGDAYHIRFPSKLLPQSSGCPKVLKINKCPSTLAAVICVSVAASDYRYNNYHIHWAS